MSAVARVDGAGSCGQGLFVARTYIVKMRRTIEAAQIEDGVEFLLTLPVTR